MGSPLNSSLSLGCSDENVLGQIPQETDSDGDLGAEGLLGSTVGVNTCEGVERTGIRQMEKLNCNAFPRDVSADLMRSFGSKMALQHIQELREGGQAFVPSC